MQSSQAAKEVVETFKQIQATGGHAAIDRDESGFLILMCSKASHGDKKTWGKGTVPQSYSSTNIRLFEC